MGTPTVLLVDQLRAIDTSYIVGDPEDYLDASKLAQLEHVVARCLGLWCSHRG